MKFEVGQKVKGLVGEGENTAVFDASVVEVHGDNVWIEYQFEASEISEKRYYIKEARLQKHLNDYLAYDSPLTKALD